MDRCNLRNTTPVLDPTGILAAEPAPVRDIYICF
jgi:hypothetical protein